ncbi:MAG: hypothetical protein HF312_15655 [Ignavibacteria bacterium]|nr:hypothetical protein [Ignavibacteria bacterium]
MKLISFLRNLFHRRAIQQERDRCLRILEREYNRQTLIAADSVTGLETQFAEGIAGALQEMMHSIAKGAEPEEVIDGHF